MVQLRPGWETQKGKAWQDFTLLLLTDAIRALVNAVSVHKGLYCFYSIFLPNASPNPPIYPGLSEVLKQLLCNTSSITRKKKHKHFPTSLSKRQVPRLSDALFQHLAAKTNMAPVHHRARGLQGLCEERGAALGHTQPAGASAAATQGRAQPSPAATPWCLSANGPALHPVRRLVLEGRGERTR